VAKYGTAGQATDDNIVRRMRFAYWINKATFTQSGYVTVIAFPLRQWSCERASMLRYITLLILFPAVVGCCECPARFPFASRRPDPKTTLRLNEYIARLNRKLLFFYCFAFISNAKDYIYHFKWHERGATEGKFEMLNYENAQMKFVFHVG